LKGLKLKIASILLVLIVLASFIKIPVVASDQSVEPVTLSATLSQGESKDFDISINTGAKPISKIDVMFTFDRTGSMGDELATVQNKAIEILNDIRTQVPDSWFGVSSFMDYPGYFEYPGYGVEYGSALYGDIFYEVNQQPTIDTTIVTSAINDLWLGYGADEPEDYTRALYEVISTHWRTDTKKIVIIFGDAPTHDLDFAGYNYGGDPGSDLLALTEDDLDFETVVSQVKHEGIVVLAVNSGDVPQSEATFKGMSIGFAGAGGTEGQYFSLDSSNQIPEAVKEMIEGEVSQIGHLTLDIPDEYKDWVSFSPGEYTAVDPESSRVFDCKVTVPSGVTSGEHTFLIRVLGDGSLLGSTQVSIIVPSDDKTNDLGFRANPDGYNFTNYKTSQSWEMFKQFFGTNAVLHSNGEKLYAAEEFYKNHYSTAGDGYSCEGMSASSLINYFDYNQSQAGTYAMSSYNPLHIATKNPVTPSIAYYQGCQMGYEIQLSFATEHGKDPEYFYNKIKQYIQNGDPVVLAIRSPDNKFGHAIVPYRIEEPSGDEKYVYVYDCNYPNDNNRKVTFNLSKNTWSYQFGSFWLFGWLIPYETWSGDSTHHLMYVTPLSMYTHQGIPMWNPASTSNFLGTNGTANTLIVDGEGHQLGFVNGQFMDEIPGAANVTPNLGINPIQTYENYLLPDNLTYNVTLFGTEQGHYNFNAFGSNFLLQINNVATNPSTIDNLSFDTQNGKFITYSTNDAFKEYSASIVEETGDTSRIFKINTQISAGDNITFGLIDDNTFKFVNDGGAKTFDWALEQRGTGAGLISFTNLPIEANSTQYISVKSLENLQSSEVVLEIDLNSDGTIDKSLILQSDITGVPGFSFWGILVCIIVFSILIILLIRKKLILD
jgi:hypothetical protein